MKIVHLCLGCFFPDGYSYQENMLPKYHKQMGHDVKVIASLATFDKDGKPAYAEKACVYNNEYGISVSRLDYKKPVKVYRKLKRYVGTYEALETAKPDILFIHGCQFMDMDIVVKYLKQHKNVKVYVDNHADFSNSATNFISKNLLHKVLWKHSAHIIEPYTSKFYGVLPARVDFLKNVYKLPADKCELLVMGADDELVQAASDERIRHGIREKYNLAEDDFVVMTGGKIDAWKTQTLFLMEAVNQIRNDKVKLIVFGSVTPDLKQSVQTLCSDRVQYIGWIDAKDSYNYFAAADLVVFPGRHSVFWEQVAAQGIPMICKYWQGTTHVDLGGNLILLKEDGAEEIRKHIENLVTSPEDYNKMKSVAVAKGRQMFSYKDIAKRAIG